jgi:Rod binding domain-containing protein
VRLDGAFRSAVAAGRAAPELRKLDKAASELEASFVKQMLSAMRRGTPETHKGQEYGGQMFRDMFDDALANAVTGRFGLGIADQVMRKSGPEVIRQEMQEMAREARAKSATTDSETGK